MPAQHVQCSKQAKSRLRPQQHAAVPGCDAIRVLLGENATDHTMPVWPVSGMTAAPVASHICLLKPSDADAIRVPSSENAAEVLLVVWLVSVATSAPVAAFHSRILQLADAESQ